MPVSRQRYTCHLPAPFVRAAVVVGMALALTLGASEGPILKVVFEPRTVVLSGRIDTEETAGMIASALTSARPDLSLDRSALVVDGSASLPDLAELPGLLAELGLSTHEGRLELWPDRLVIGGLTDSLVTQSALRIRAKPLMSGRTLHNRLCIVGTDDLPKLEVSLAGAGAGPSTPSAPSAPALVAAPVGSFEMPGLSFAKLLAVIRLPGQIDRLSGKQPAPAPPAPTNGETKADLPSPPTMPPTPAMPLTATPVQQFETLPSVLFSRNSFLLQANQQATIEGLLKHLLSPIRRGAPVRIEAVKASGGSTAFNEYLCERRAAEVARFLTEGGVDAATVQVKTVESNSPVDEGEVRLFVEILSPPEPPAPEGAATAMPPSAVTPAPADAPKSVP